MSRSEESLLRESISRRSFSGDRSLSVHRKLASVSAPPLKSSVVRTSPSTQNHTIPLVFAGQGRFTRGCQVAAKQALVRAPAERAKNPFSRINIKSTVCLRRAGFARQLSRHQRSTCRRAEYYVSGSLLLKHASLLSDMRSDKVLQL